MKRGTSSEYNGVQYGAWGGPTAARSHVCIVPNGQGGGRIYKFYTYMFALASQHV